MCIGSACGVSGLSYAITCPTWNANYTLAPLQYHESAAIRHQWSPRGSCDTFTFHHYLACYYSGHADDPPAAPPDVPNESGSTCVDLGTASSASSFNQFTHRSSRAYNARIFACQTASCDQYYGDGSYGYNVTYDTAEEATDPERWVLEDIEDFDDSDRVVLGDNVGGPGALFYPDGWTSEGVLGLWFIDVDEEIIIYYTSPGTAGWMNFNTTDMAIPIEVARESPDSSFAGATNPWVVAEEEVEGEEVVDRRIQMFFHTGTGSALDVWSVSSVDEDGTDFNLECLSTSCAVSGGGTCAENDMCDWDSSDATMDLCRDNSAGCYYLASAGHGRIMWDYVLNGAVNFEVDQPGMLFTGDNFHGACSYGGGPADTYQATWSDTGMAWEVPLSGSCPEYDPNMEDRHDPAVIPLPGGAFKAYVMDADAGQQHLVCYSDDGETWDDCANIEFAFDDGSRLGSTTEDPMPCLGDLDALVFLDVGGPHEGGFLQASEGDGVSACVVAGPFADGGIVFVEHRN